MSIVLRDLMKLSGVEVTDASVALWFEAFQRTSEDELRKAFAAHMQESPKAPRIFDIAQSMNRPKASVLIRSYCAYRGVTFKAISGSSRKRPLVQYRQELKHILRTKTSFSLPQIGDALNRDHTTIIHGIKAHERREAQGIEI